ncbi:ParB/RepB/Spo0J family partition protein [Streptomyces sp. NPDC058691]|uniref:ParB/RepB/Spo0J family partition protein n=1 Tax=Streptomyces sp. NPDC058691 TaxID=3346601 RepID=UPI003669AA9F
MTIRTIPIGKIHRNERQPREFFEPVALQELADSIKRFGLMQPIEVRRDKDAGGYEIVAGERRWRAHQLAEITHIKCIITDDDMTTLERFKRSVAENINRADMTPIEEAKAFRRILDDQEDVEVGAVAKEFGKTTQYVNLRLALLNLTDEVQQHVNSGAIGTQAAVQIASLTPGNQAAVMKKWVKGAFAGDNELVHFAYALGQQQNQTFALIVEDLSEEQRAERKRERTATRNKLDAVERVRELLEELAKADPMKLALALEGEVLARLEQMDRVADAVQKARFNLRQAKAHAEAREIVVNPEAADAKPAPAEPAAADREFVPTA